MIKVLYLKSRLRNIGSVYLIDSENRLNTFYIATHISPGNFYETTLNNEDIEKYEKIDDPWRIMRLSRDAVTTVFIDKLDRIK